MRKVKTCAGAQRAFEWFSRNVAPSTGRDKVRVEFEIHSGAGECVCTACERSRIAIDQIVRAGK